MQVFRLQEGRKALLPSLQTQRLQGKRSPGPCLVLKQRPVCCHMRISQIRMSSDFLSNSVRLEAEAAEWVSGAVTRSASKEEQHQILPRKSQAPRKPARNPTRLAGGTPDMNQSGVNSRPPALHTLLHTVSSPPGLPQSSLGVNSPAWGEVILAKHSLDSGSWGPDSSETGQERSYPHWSLIRGWGAPCGSRALDSDKLGSHSSTTSSYPCVSG